MRIREVDERDTQWEATQLMLRLLVTSSAGIISAFDFDDANLRDVERWMKDRGLSRDQVSLGLRTTNEAGAPGLAWIWQPA